jgi:hypothetical protein
VDGEALEVSFEPFFGGGSLYKIPNPDAKGSYQTVVITQELNYAHRGEKLADINKLAYDCILEVVSHDVVKKMQKKQVNI